MAKFTLFFKDKAISSKIFDSGIVRIGRDETNDIIIDNLAVAPAHAAVIIKENSCVIKQLNDDYALNINNEISKETILQNNDKISIGKHYLIFNTIESINSPVNDNTANKDVDQLNNQLEENINTPDANLQVLDGEHIGRILPLKKPMTRLGHSGSGVAIIAKRKEGYFISSLETASNIKVNHNLLSDQTINLKNNDIVVIDNTSMQFFLDY